MAISSDTIVVQWLRSDQVKNPAYSQAEAIQHAALKLL
jgi:hypothetical protein